MTTVKDTRPLAVGAYFAAHQQKLVRMVSAYRPTAPHALVEEACQTAWERLLSHADELNDAPVPWLLVVARRELNAQLRRRHYDDLPLARPDGTPLDVEDPRSTLDLHVEAREALREVARLRPHQRTAVARQAAGLSFGEIMAEQGCARAWVNRHLYRGRAALRAAA